MNNNMNQNLNNQVPPVPPVQPVVEPQPVPVQYPMLQPVVVEQPVKQKTNRLCIVALIFAFLIAPVGLILGIIGIGDSKKEGEKGACLAIAAIIVSLIPIVHAIAFCGLIIGGINGRYENQIACNKLDENGDYKSLDGVVICEDYTCEYKTGVYELSHSCSVVNTEDSEEYEEETEEDTNNKTEKPQNETINEPENNTDDTIENNTQSVQTTQNSCSTKFQSETYTENDDFMMYIEKVYTVSGRGTFISGTILKGTVKLNDQVEIVGLNREPQTTVVTGLEVNREARDSIKIGEEAAILLSGLATSDIEVGQVIAKPKSVTTTSEVEVELCVLSKEDGGRHTPFFNNYRPVVQLGSKAIQSTVILPTGIEMVMPGDTLTLKLKLDTPVVLETGSVITLNEGGRVIGTGKVKRVVN